MNAETTDKWRGYDDSGIMSCHMFVQNPDKTNYTVEIINDYTVMAKCWLQTSGGAKWRWIYQDPPCDPSISP